LSFERPTRLFPLGKAPRKRQKIMENGKKRKNNVKLTFERVSSWARVCAKVAVTAHVADDMTAGGFTNYGRG